MHFTFSQPVLRLFGVHFITITENLLIETSYVYYLLVDAAKICFISFFALAANLQHFGTNNSALDFFGNLFMADCTFGVESIVLGKNPLLATSFEVLMLIVLEKNSPVSILVLFLYQI